MFIRKKVEMYLLYNELYWFFRDAQMFLNIIKILLKFNKNSL